MSDYVCPFCRLSSAAGRVAISSQYEFEGEAHYEFNEVGPDGSWRNWNPDTRHSRPILKDREPLYP
jgi:hypothetical protein